MVRDGDAAHRATRTAGIAAGEAVRLVGLVLAAIGGMLGAGAAAGAFSFQPYGRINVVSVLGLLVVLPNLTLAFAVFHALPEGVRRRLPFLGRDDPDGGSLQPARWALRALPQPTRRILDEALGTTGALGKLTAPLRRWLLLRASQSAALAFQSGALAAALAQVVFTDLSFGWSTTLDVGAGTVHALSTLIAAPWSLALPDAVPSRELIDRTRFFRIAPAPDETVAFYGTWWPFVVAAVFVYGWLPRAVFLWIAHRRVRATIRRAMERAPGSRQVLARLESPLVLSASPDLEADAGDRSTLPGISLADSALPPRAVVISWGDARTLLGSRFREAWVVSCHEAGGTRTPREDERAVARAAAEALEQAVPVVLAVRGYEPPLAEQIDFIGALRRELGDAQPLVVAAIGSDEARLDAWRRRLTSLGDPWLAIAAVPLERS